MKRRRQAQRNVPPGQFDEALVNCQTMEGQCVYLHAGAHQLKHAVVSVERGCSR